MRSDGTVVAWGLNEDGQCISPNPFRRSAVLAFELREAGNLELECFDLIGRRLRSAELGQFSTGSHRTRWNSGERFGERLPTGVYLVRVRSGTSVSRAVKVAVTE
jgi:hypothetical protein